MRIERPIATRLAIGFGSVALLVLYVVGFVFAAVSRHVSDLAAAFMVVVGVAVFGYFAYWGGAPTWVDADNELIRFQPSIGKARVFRRSQLAKMVLVSAARAGSTVEFRGQDGTVLFATDTLFERSNFERLADYLRVPLQWRA